MLRRSLLLLPLLSALACAPVAPPATTAAPSAALDGFLRRQVEDRRVASIAALVVRADGTVLYQGVAGPRDPALPAEALRTDHLFRLASMTKPITSVAALMLVEEGRLGLDDPLDRYLPEFRGLRVREAAGAARTVPAARAPTIRDLLRHMAGFSYNFMNVPAVAADYARFGVTDGLADPEYDARVAALHLARAPLQFQPGTAWGYSLSTDVLGWVVERVSGRPLDAFVAERIARPLRMDDFAFRVPRDRAGRMVAAMRPAEGGGLRPLRAGEPVLFPATGGTWRADPERAYSATAYPSGGAGATGTIGDYARFARMLLNGGELDGARLLRPETVALMTAPQTGGLPISLRGAGHDFGLGVSVVTDPAAARTLQSPGTYGWGGIYGTGFFVDPVRRMAIVVMTQTATNGGAVAGEFREAFYREARPGS